MEKEPRNLTTKNLKRLKPLNNLLLSYLIFLKNNYSFSNSVLFWFYGLFYCIKKLNCSL